MTPDTDVLIIGAGPAGSTAAALLAEKGRSVRVLEKEHFPRYHVGESLMPFCWYTLNRLGLTEKMDEIGFTQKQSVSFVTPDGRQSRPFYFYQHREHPSSITWQVERNDFDQMIFDRASELGADIRQGVTVREPLRDDSGKVIGLRAQDESGAIVDYHASIVIDASGRDAFLSRKEQWRKRDPELDNIALWTYYDGAKRDPGIDEGTTTVAYVPEGGWFWYIPLRNNRVSLGLVGKRDYLFRDDVRDPAAIIDREVENNLWIKDHLSPGQQDGEYWITGEFSYRSRHCAGDGFVLAGDAFAFLDPVFSSGVFLALKTGELAADAVDAALTRGDVSGSSFDSYGDTVCDAIERMRALVYAFYDQEFSFARLIKQNPDLKGDLTDCLIGDLFQDKFEPLFKAVGEIATLPPHLPHGRTGSERLQTAAA
ncbi:MAG: NAD(P)/FAD-dependent oxidoreductase [Verrucomicrobiota bacterium]